MIEYFNENCFERFSKIKDNSIQAIITDPPYGVGFHGQQDPDTNWDKFKNDEFYILIKNLLTECKRVIKQNGTIWMCFANPQVEVINKVIQEVGLINHLDKWRILGRSKGRGAKNRLKSLREDIFCLSKNEDFYYDESEWEERCVELEEDNLKKPRGWLIDISKGTRKKWTGKGNVMFFSMPYYLGVGEKMIHSCQKPILMWSELIMCSTKEGDTIYDPFAGSFSSGIAAYLTNRQYIGTELDTDMYKKAQKWRHSVEDESSVTRENLNGLIKEKKGYKFGKLFFN